MISIVMEDSRVSIIEWLRTSEVSQGDKSMACNLFPCMCTGGDNEVAALAESTIGEYEPPWPMAAKEAGRSARSLVADCES